MFSFLYCATGHFCILAHYKCPFIFIIIIIIIIIIYAKSANFQLTVTIIEPYQQTNQ